MASELRVNTLKDASGNNSVGMSTVANGSAKAFISFDGTGTVSIDTSFNVSTLTDHGSAEYSITYSNNMGTSNHPITGSNVGSSETNFYSYICSTGVAQTTSVDRIHSVHNNGSANNDQDPVHLVTNGDLA